MSEQELELKYEYILTLRAGGISGIIGGVIGLVTKPTFVGLLVYVFLVPGSLRGEITALLLTNAPALFMSSLVCGILSLIFAAGLMAGGKLFKVGSGLTAGFCYILIPLYYLYVAAGLASTAFPGTPLAEFSPPEPEAFIRGFAPLVLLSIYPFSILSLTYFYSSPKGDSGVSGAAIIWLGTIALYLLTTTAEFNLSSLAFTEVVSTLSLGLFFGGIIDMAIIPMGVSLLRQSKVAEAALEVR